MKNRAIIPFVIILLFLPSVFAGVKIQLGESYVNLGDVSEIEFSSHGDHYEICSLDRTIVPILIKNGNTFSDTFSFEVDKEYVSLPVKSVVLASGKNIILPLTIIPPFDVEENTSIILDVISKKEALKRSVVLKTDIRKCYGGSLEIDKDKDSICGLDKGAYTLVLENKGKSKDTFILTFDMPEWVTSDLVSDTLELADGEKKEILLEANPSEGEKGTFYINSKAVSEKAKLVVEVSLELNVLPKDNCYNTIISADNIRIDYFGGSVPITIRNKGKDATYSLSVGGVDWYILDQTEFSLKQNNEKIINLALDPSEDVAEGKYTAEVKAKIGDQEFVKSFTVNLSSKGSVLEQIKFYLNYLKYYIGAVVVLFVVIFLLVIFVRRIKKKKRKKRVSKEEKKVEKKESKVVSKKVAKRKLKLFEYIYLIAVVFLFLAIITYLGYRFFGKGIPLDKLGFLIDFVKSHHLYFIIGAGALILLVLAIWFIPKIPKRAKSKKKVEVKKASKKVKRKINKRLKSLIIIIIGLVILSGIVYSLAYYGLVEYIKEFLLVYYPYILMGVGILIILILILSFYGKDKSS